jgi:hypothetical protein
LIDGTLSEDLWFTLAGECEGGDEGEEGKEGEERGKEEDLSLRPEDLLKEER